MNDSTQERDSLTGGWIVFLGFGTGLGSAMNTSPITIFARNE